MNKKKYVRPNIHVVHLMRMPLLHVTSVQSQEVNWYILGFDEVDKDR